MSALGKAGGVSRREMLGAVARWTVPTVATLTLGARVLEAKASCPPCQKKVGAVCRACTISQMLNCQCEPCLGPPYCAAVGPVAPMGTSTPAPGSNSLMAPAPGQGNAPGGPTLSPYLQSQRDRARTLRDQDPFKRPMYRDPFGVDRSGDQPSPGLYQRLRPDSLRRVP